MRRDTVTGGNLARRMRRWRLDRNPLRRPADRVEALLLAALAVAFLVSAPLAAVAAGQSAAAAARHTEHVQASWRPATAVLLRNAPDPAQAQASLAPLVLARWRAPDGVARTGEVYAQAGARAGSSVPIWVTRSGQPVPFPMMGSDVTIRVALAALLATTVTAVVLALLGLVGRWLLDRRRMAAWDARWAITEPQWSGRR
ncbi:MAG TPA: hypothetical protein VIX86_18715 [Streptosporangiaceae bacterium]